MPGAGDTYCGGPASRQDQAKRFRDVRNSRAARRRVPQAGRIGRIDHIQVDVDIQRATWQGSGIQACTSVRPMGAWAR